MIKRLLLLGVLTLLLGACSLSNPQVASTPTTGSEPSPLPPTSAPSPSPTIPPTAMIILPSATPAATATPVMQDYGPKDFPPNIDPLTGLPASNSALLNKRPLSVKIQIFPRGQRPPWGISLADLVYDYYQNNGMTRLHAVFYGNSADQVGPIRSGRLFDMNVVRMYKTIFAFGGADQRILTRFVNSEFADRLVMEGSHNCPPMCRIDPNSYNYLVTNTTELSKYAEAQGVKDDRQDLNGMTFSPTIPTGGTPGSQIFSRVSISAYTRWDYDPATGRYLRFQDNQEDSGQGEAYVPMVDRLNNQQASAANVVVLFTPHQFVVKSAATEIVDIPLSGSGDAVAFRDGNAYKVKWNRPTPDSVLYLTFPDGSNYPFKPGNTWFEVIGQSSKTEIKDAGVWRFTFSFP
jgi:hypothetical protein